MYTEETKKKRQKKEYICTRYIYRFVPHRDTIDAF